MRIHTENEFNDTKQQILTMITSCEPATEEMSVVLDSLARRTNNSNNSEHLLEIFHEVDTCICISYKRRLLKAIDGYKLFTTKPQRTKLDTLSQWVVSLPDNRNAISLIFEALDTFRSTLKRKLILLRIILVLGVLYNGYDMLQIWRAHGAAVGIADFVLYIFACWGINHLIDRRIARTKQPKLNPPALAEFLLLLVPKRDREHLVGDLEEEFRTILLPKHGPFKAHCYYWWHVTICIFPYVFRFLRRILSLAMLLRLIGK